MDRTKLIYLVNLGLAIVFFAVFITGLTKFLALHPFTGINNFVLPWAQISLLHDWSGIAMAALVLIHLALNWEWIVKTTGEIVRGEKE